MFFFIFQECHPTYETKCETVYETTYETKYDKKCHTEYEPHCEKYYETTYEKQCDVVYDQKVSGNTRIHTKSFFKNMNFSKNIQLSYVKNTCAVKLHTGSLDVKHP